MPQGVGSWSGTSTTFVSSRPSTSTVVVMKRRGEVPVVPVSRISIAIGPSQNCRGAVNRANDLRVRPAAAEVAAHRSRDRVIGGVPVTREQCHGGQHLTRRTETALHGVVVDERLLDGV